MKIKPTIWYHISLTRMVKTRKTENTTNWWGCGENWNPLILLMGMETGQPPWQSLVVPQKVKQSVTMWPSNSTPRRTRWRMKTYVHTTLITNAYSGIMHNSQNMGTTQMAMLINKTWDARTTEYFSVMKRNEALTPATKWMSLENRLSEQSQSQETVYCLVPSSMWSAQNRQIHRDRR